MRHFKPPLVIIFLQADPVLVRAPQRLRGVITLLGVEVASGMERSNWRLVFPTGTHNVDGRAESSRMPCRENENKNKATTVENTAICLGLTLKSEQHF